METNFNNLDTKVVNFNDLDKVTFDTTVYNEVTKASDNTSAITQDNSNVTYDNFLLHSSKEWLSTLENNSAELIKGAKDTADKIKGDSKVIAAVKKAAPDGQPFKDVEKKLAEGVGQLASSVAAAVDISKYSGAINFISSTAIRNITGDYQLIADMNVDIKGPAITTTSNVNVTNAAYDIDNSDVKHIKTDNYTRVSTNDLNSTTNKHTVATQGVSTNSTSNKTTAVEDHQVVADKLAQYGGSLVALTKESTVIGTKGTAKIQSSGDFVIASGQSLKQGLSQASFDTPASIGGTTDGGVAGNATTIPGAALGTTGSITILSTGGITSKATGAVLTQADTVGSNSSKFAVASVDTSLNSTTTTISSKVQSSVISEGISYTGTRNMGISINPFGILVGTGVAPLIPLLTELLPPIIVDVPELPEFPFGSLADFLAKCLPFTTAVDIPNKTSQPTATTVDDNIINVSIEDPIVEQDKNGGKPAPLDISFTPITQSKGNVDKPTDISKSSATAVEPATPTGTVSQQTIRDITNTATGKTTNTEQRSFTWKDAAGNAAKLGVAHFVLPNQPGINANAKTTPTVSSSDSFTVNNKQTFDTSLKSLTSLQQSNVVNAFSASNRTSISANYSSFLQAVATLEVFGPAQSATNSKIVNDFLANKKLVEEIKTFLNTQRPIGTGGQQPPNIQQYDTPATLGSPINGGVITNSIVRTPPIPGQGLIDMATNQALFSQPVPSTSIFGATSENWYSPQQITEFQESDIKFGDELTNNSNLASVSELLNNKYVDLAKNAIPDDKIKSALSLTQDIAAGRITTPQQYANRLASLVGGEVGGYISYAEQAFNIYDQVQAGNYTSLLGIPGVSNVLGSKGTAVASKILGLIGKKDISDKDLYDVAGSIFTALTGIGIPLLDELAKLLGCIDSIKEQQPFLQSISNPDLQDIIDYLPRIIQTTKDKKVLNITPSNCGQISELSAEEATINVTEVGAGYIKFKLDNKDLISFNNHPLPTIGTPVNVYTEFYSDRINNLVLMPYKVGSQFTSNIIEYKITNKTVDTYTATLINRATILTLEDNISGSLYQYTTADIGNRLAPYILDSYILL